MMEKSKHSSMAETTKKPPSPGRADREKVHNTIKSAAGSAREQSNERDHTNNTRRERTRRRRRHTASESRGRFRAQRRFRLQTVQETPPLHCLAPLLRSAAS